MQTLQNLLATIFLITFCVTIFVVATSENATSQNGSFRVRSHPQFSKKFSGIAKVIDGDSITVDDREVRLVGIDAPEYKQDCFDAENNQYSCGIIAQKFLQKLINNKEVTCRYSEKDRYNRFLAKCEIDKISINQEIIKNGMAVIYNFEESDEVTEKLESQARKQKIGIWQGAFQLPKDYRKSHPRKK